MPKVDGVAATRRIMARAPCAILIVTASVSANTSSVYEAMGAGALDAVDTPTLALGLSTDARRRRCSRRSTRSAGCSKAAPRRSCRRAGARARPADARRDRCVGGRADRAVRALPGDFPAAIVIVQHVDQAFALGMAEWLDGYTRLPVRVARQGSMPQAGEVLLAATNDHLTLPPRGVLGYTRHPVETPYRPSIDVFFNSVADGWQGEAFGAADGHGARRRARPEGDAREGLLHDRAGRGDQRRLRDAEGGRGDRRGVGDPAARADRAPTDLAHRACCATDGAEGCARCRAVATLRAARASRTMAASGWHASLRSYPARCCARCGPQPPVRPADDACVFLGRQEVAGRPCGFLPPRF